MKPLDVAALQKGLRALHGRLTEDLVKRADLPEVEPVLRETHGRLTDARRTGEDFTLWRRHFAAQVASSWILSTLFIRVLEDRGFLPRRRLAGEGPAGEQARESRETISQLAPLGARDYLLLVFQEMMTFEAARALFEPANALAWRLGPSDTAAGELIAFWGEPDPDDTGRLLFAFDTQRAPDTRFLGDVYEALDPDARRRFALVQTPRFLERFILDRALEPALKTFGLGSDTDPIRVIDPTCGSGHFLLDAFARLVQAWSQSAPNAGSREWVTRALRSIFGTDINPYAVAIARFRLTLAAIEASGVTTLVGAPAFPLNLAVADALLWGAGPEALTKLQRELRDSTGVAWVSALFDVESLPDVERLLLETRYHVVVGNPPYDPPSDRVLAAEYKQRYVSCYKEFTLGAVFVERFLLLACEGGYVGLVTSKGFADRNYGKKLIEKVLPRFDLQAFYDTANVPWSSVATCVLIARARPPASGTVRVVIGLRGERDRPKAPELGEVWQSLSKHADEAGFRDDVIAVLSVERSTLGTHAWRLGSQQKSDLVAKLASGANRVPLRSLVWKFGYFCDTHADEAFIQPGRFFQRQGIPDECSRTVVRGRNIRDWGAVELDRCVFPYDASLEKWESFPIQARWWWFWDLRPLLGARKTFGGKTYVQAGRSWYDFHQFPRNRAKSKYAIAVAGLATHNRFLLVREHWVLDRSAPMLWLKDPTDLAQHQRVLGVLNSSLFGHLARCAIRDMGAQGVGRGATTESWERFRPFDGGRLLDTPVVVDTAVQPYVEELDRLGEAATSRIIPARFSPLSAGQLRDGIAEFVSSRRRLLARMRGLQEELDWLVYELYGLVSPGAAKVAAPPDVPGLELGHRAFEIALARRVDSGELTTAWFVRHGSTPTTQVPSVYSRDYQERIRARLLLIESVPEAAILEVPECKRRWSHDDLDSRVKRELRELLLDRIEDLMSRSEVVQSVRMLAHALGRDAGFCALAEVLTDQVGVSIDALIGELLEEESVPAFSACCYTTTGLEKRALWGRVREAQRLHDKGDNVEVPILGKEDRYKKEDFQGEAWSHRGKLDVPKERFLSFPGCEAGSDSTAVYGWAGWDHARRAHALADVFERRRTEDGWDRERLKSLLAGIQELIPWLLQWHNEPSAAFGGERPGEAFSSWLETQLSALALSPAELRAWRPPKGRVRATTRRVVPASARAEEADDEDPLDAEAPPEEPPDEPPPNDRPKRRTGRAPAASLDSDRVLSALRDLGGTATLAALTEAVGEPQKAIRAAADALVEAGRLEQTKQRPITYALAGPVK